MIKKNGKTYYDSKELDNIIYDYIRQTAKELKLELGKKQNKLGVKKAEYV